MGVSQIDGDLFVNGAIKSKDLYIPIGAVKNDQVSATDPLKVEKTEHRYVAVKGQKHADTAAVERSVVHVAQGNGTVESFQILATVACIGDSTITVDLLNNGSTILSTVPSLSSSNAAFALVLGVVGTATYTTGDVFEISVSVSAGTGTLGKGLNAVVKFREGF